MDIVATTIFGYTFATLLIIPFIVVWILIAFLPANMAKNKGRSFLGWFLLSLFFWWITFFLVLFMPPKNPQPAPVAPVNPPNEQQ